MRPSKIAAGNYKKNSILHLSLLNSKNSGKLILIFAFWLPRRIKLMTYKNFQKEFFIHKCHVLPQLFHIAENLHQICHINALCLSLLLKAPFQIKTKSSIDFRFTLIQLSNSYLRWARVSWWSWVNSRCSKLNSITYI